MAKISETIWTKQAQTGQAVENQKLKHPSNGDLSPPPTSSCCVQCAEPTGEGDSDYITDAWGSMTKSFMDSVFQKDFS